MTQSIREKLTQNNPQDSVTSPQGQGLSYSTTLIMNVIGMPGIIGGIGFSANSSSPINNGGGTKRPLASCREELERSWETLGGGSPSSSSSSTMHQQHHNHQQFLHLVSHDDYSDDDMVVHGRNKRRRTGLASSSIIADDCNMDSDMTVNNNSGGWLCKEVRRISPDNRPPFVMLADPATSNISAAAAASSSSVGSRPPIKAGWYTGALSVNGHRHGVGTTKHDDGTTYTGPYINDLMNGYGTYTFTTTRHLVPNPKMNGNSLHRVIEKSYEGIFSKDAPLGKGIVITKSVDSLPVCGSSVGWAAQNYSVPSNIQHVEVIHDVGMHNSDGVAIGEGVRIMYSASWTDGGSVLEQECFRLLNGKVTMKVALDYAKWVCSCMSMEIPSPPGTTLSEDVGMFSR